jgi:hypothetical protein
MATGCDVSESEVTGSDVTGIDFIRPKVGDYPWGVILIVRGVVWYSNGVFYHVRVLTVVSLLNNIRATDRGLCAAAAADRGIYTAAVSADRWICAVVAQQQQYSQSNEGEPYYILKTNNPVFFGFQTNTIPIISCHGYIRLPV